MSLGYRFSFKLSDGFESKSAWRVLAVEICRYANGDLRKFENIKDYLKNESRTSYLDAKAINRVDQFFSNLKKIVTFYPFISPEVIDDFDRGSLVFSTLSRNLGDADFLSKKTNVLTKDVRASEVESTLDEIPDVDAENKDYLKEYFRLVSEFRKRDGNALGRAVILYHDMPALAEMANDAKIERLVRQFISAHNASVP